MCDPAGKLPDRLHLLALAQTFFSLHQIGGALGNALLERLVEGTQRSGRTIALRFDSTLGFDIDENTGKALRRTVRPAIDAPVRLDPIIMSVRPQHAILVRIGTASFDCLAHRGRQCRLIVGMDRLDDLRERDAIASDRGVETEGASKSVVDGEAVGWDIPMPGADDRAGLKREPHPLDIPARNRLTNAQTLLRLARRGYVVEQDGDLPVIRIADANCASIPASASVARRRDTSASSSSLVMVILASVAEMERELIRERTIAGLAAARAKGGTGGGRKSVMTPDMLDTARKLLKAGDSPARIAKLLQVVRLTFYRHFPATEREPA